MIILYALLVAMTAAGETLLYVRLMPRIRQNQNKFVSRLFFWGAILPGWLVGVSFIVFMILFKKLGTPLQMLAVTLGALALGFVGGWIVLRAVKR